MTDTVDQLKERVLVLQRQLELKRKLLKNAEQKSRLSKRRANTISVLPTLDEDAPTATSKLIDADDCRADPIYWRSLTTVANFTSCKSACCGLLPVESSLLTVICLLLDTDKVVIFLDDSLTAESREAVWQKSICSENVLFVSILIAPTVCHNDVQFALFTSELHREANALLLSLYLFRYLSPTRVDLTDVLTYPLVIRTESPQKFQRLSFTCKIFGSPPEGRWICLYSPLLSGYFLFKLFDYVEGFCLKLIRSVLLTSQFNFSGSNWIHHLTTCTNTLSGNHLVGSHSQITGPDVVFDCFPTVENDGQQVTHSSFVALPAGSTGVLLLDTFSTIINNNPFHILHSAIVDYMPSSPGGNRQTHLLLSILNQQRASVLRFIPLHVTDPLSTKWLICSHPKKPLEQCILRFELRQTKSKQTHIVTGAFSTQSLLTGSEEPLAKTHSLHEFSHSSILHIPLDSSMQYPDVYHHPVLLLFYRNNTNAFNMRLLP